MKPVILDKHLTKNHFVFLTENEGVFGVLRRATAVNQEGQRCFGELYLTFANKVEALKYFKRAGRAMAAQSALQARG